MCYIRTIHGFREIESQKSAPVKLTALALLVLRVNTSKTEPFMIRGESIEDVDSFVYLGSKVTKDGGALQDVAQ